MFVDQDEEEEELPPLPSFRRSTVMTSDYESSNDSPPSGSEEAGARLLRSNVAVQTSSWAGKGPCALCGRSTVLTPSPLTVAPPITHQVRKNFFADRASSLTSWKFKLLGHIQGQDTWRSRVCFKALLKSILFQSIGENQLFLPSSKIYSYFFY